MNIGELLADKSKKPKEKTELLSKALTNREISISQVLAFATAAKDPAKATCIEAMEYATAVDPGVIDVASFRFVTDALTSKAPRVKWESAKVIGNTARLFPAELDKAVAGLLANAEDEGTVVRWSAAFALGEIVQLRGPRNKDLVPAMEAIAAREEKNSIKKIYLAALRKAR